MKGVTPILTAVAPAATMDRPDGAHSGNPDVRKEVAAGVFRNIWLGPTNAPMADGHSATPVDTSLNWGRPEMQNS